MANRSPQRAVLMCLVLALVASIAEAAPPDRSWLSLQCAHIFRTISDKPAVLELEASSVKIEIIKDPGVEKVSYGTNGKGIFKRAKGRYKDAPAKEVAVYDFYRAMQLESDFHMPETRYVKIGQDTGSLQAFVEGARNVARVDELNSPSGRAIRIFDFLIGNRDRTSIHNYLISPTGEIIAIDHEMAFSPRVIWVDAFFSEDLSLKGGLRDLLPIRRAFYQKLKALSPAEIRAILQRHFNPGQARELGEEMIGRQKALLTALDRIKDQIGEEAFFSP